MGRWAKPGALSAEHDCGQIFPNEAMSETSWWPERRRGDLVSYLTEDELARLWAAMEPCTAGEGDLVFQKGSPSRSLLLVEQGWLDVFDQAMGEEVVLGSIGPGMVAGEVGFVDGQVRTHHVRARGDCRLRRLTRERLLELVKDDPQLFAKITIALARLVASRFRAAVDELEPVRAFAASLARARGPVGRPGRLRRDRRAAAHGRPVRARPRGGGPPAQGRGPQVQEAQEFRRRVDPESYLPPADAAVASERTYSASGG